jgi:hypothetical protein
MDKIDAIQGSRMDPIKEFAAFQGKTYAATTRRVYVSAARKALKISGKTPNNCGSYGELLALLEGNLAQMKFPKALKLAPFLRFLESKLPKTATEKPDYQPIRSWVVDRIEEETKTATKTSHHLRRDLAMLAGLCVAPGKGSPRRWPKSALAVTRQRGGGFKVKLWDRAVATQGLALALLYWHTWRERLDRPEQSRIYRKAWAYSDLLFPNSKGEALTKYAMRNALSRLSVRGEGRIRLTPGMVRQAFLQLEE